MYRGSAGGKMTKNNWWSGDKLSCVWTSLPFCRVNAMHILREYSGIFPTVVVRWQIITCVNKSSILYGKSYAHSSGIFRNIPAKNVSHILCWNIPQYSRRMCIAFTLQNGRLVHTHIICHRTTNCFSSFSRLHCLCTQSVHSYYYVIIISAMEEDISIACIAVNTTLIFAAALLKLRRLRRKKRRVWVREILCKRRQEGAHHD